MLLKLVKYYDFSICKKNGCISLHLENFMKLSILFSENFPWKHLIFHTKSLFGRFSQSNILKGYSFLSEFLPKPLATLRWREVGGGKGYLEVTEECV